MRVTWNTICSHAFRVLKREDALLWMHSIQDILEHPRFLRDPLPLKAWASPIAMRAHLQRMGRPELMAVTWVTPHPRYWEMLGCYLVWKPEDFWSPIVYGECAVRDILGLPQTPSTWDLEREAMK